MCCSHDGLTLETSAALALYLCSVNPCVTCPPANVCVVCVLCVCMCAFMCICMRVCVTCVCVFDGCVGSVSMRECVRPAAGGSGGDVCWPCVCVCVCVCVYV